MAGILRATAQLFGTTALTPSSGFAGAANSDLGTEIGSTNSVANIQSGISGQWAAGWLAAVLGSSKFPAIEDMNAVDLVFSTQIAYLLERGIPEYDAGTTYNIGDICRGIGLSTIYKSLINANTGNALSNGTDWQFCGDLVNIGGELPVTSITGANHAYVAADTSQVIERSNAGTAMADTLPGTSGALANGWYGYVKNIDATASLTVGVGSGGSITVGLVTGSFIIEPGETYLINSGGAGAYIATLVGHAVKTTNAPAGTRSALKIATTSNTAGTITAASLVVADANGNSYKLSNISQSYATGTSGAGGVDTGSIAPGNWYEFIAFNPTTHVNTALISLSATAPTLPSGYTAFARVGAIIVDSSSHILWKIQYDNEAQLIVGTNPATVLQMAVGVNGTVTVGPTVAVGVAGFVPPTASAIRVIGRAPQGSSLVAAPNNAYGGNINNTNPPPIQIQTGSASSSSSEVAMMLLESSNIFWAADNAASFLGCFGWKDNL